MNIKKVKTKSEINQLNKLSVEFNIGFFETFILGIYYGLIILILFSFSFAVPMSYFLFILDQIEIIDLSVYKILYPILFPLPLIVLTIIIKCIHYIFKYFKNNI
jgi:hypothetical protein